MYKFYQFKFYNYKLVSKIILLFVNKLIIYVSYYSVFVSSSGWKKSWKAGFSTALDEAAHDHTTGEKRTLLNMGREHRFDSCS